MNPINFYHVTALPLEKALPRLLERAHKAGEAVLVLAENDQQRQQLNETLWTYTTKYFLPHGSHEDPNPAEQPIYLTEKHENVNHAGILAFVGMAEPESLEGYKRCLYMFDGNDARQLTHARSQWKRYKEQGHSLTYWQQTPKGQWEEGATA